MSTKGIQRILAALQEKGPLSAREIAQAAFVATTSLSGGGYLKRLKATNRIHICGWRKASNGFTTPLYKAGAGVDLPRPKFRNADRDSIGMAKIVAALKEAGTMTYREIALASGLSPNTIKNARYMDILVEQRRVHIETWHRNQHGPMVAVSAAGRGRNAPRPQPQTNAEKLRQLRLRQRMTAGLPGLLQQLQAA